MNQDLIWDHFQNEGAAAFSGSGARVEFIGRQLSAGERVLNIGVGTGSLEHRAAAKGVEIWSLDPSERAIARLRNSLDLGERAQVGYSQDMPFPDAYFDVVVMSEVLEHLEDEVLAKTIDEVRRVLRQPGRFIGTVPARENLSESAVVCPQCDHHFHRWGHQSSFDVDQLRAVLKRGFSEVHARELFLIEWEAVGLAQKLSGLVKRFLSWRGIGTYGSCRNIFFTAHSGAVGDRT